MRLKFIGIFTLLFTTICGFSQDEAFITSYGNTGYDFARDIKQDNDSGYVVTGSSTSFGADNAEAYLLKVDKSGNFMWSYNYGGSGSEWGQNLVVTIDSTYAIAGFTNSYGAGGFDFYLVRIDAEGIPIWEKYYGGTDWDRAFAMIELPDSGFVLVGESYSFNDGIQSGYMVRTDKDGEMIWEQFIDNPSPTFIQDVALDGDSLIICGGIGDGGEETYDAYFAKYHINGDFGWERQIGQEYNDYFNAVFVQGDFYSFGGSRGYRFPEEQANMWMYRSSNIGEEVVDTVYENTSIGVDLIHDIAVREDQDYSFVGETTTYGYIEDGKADIFVGKMSPTYSHVAQGNYGEKGVDVGYALDPTRDGGVVFVGDTESDFFGTGGNNVVIIKLTAFWDHTNFFEFVTTDMITNSLVNYGDESATNLVVYPNPFQDVINLPEINVGLYSVLGIDGQLIVENEKINNQIDLSYLESGIYLLRVQTEEGVFQQRLIKN